MTEHGRRTAAIVAGVGLAVFVVLVAASLRGGAQGGGGRSDTDGAFIAGMVPHHQAAVQMAEVALDRSKRPEIRRLARGIVASQTDEMSVLREIHLRLYGMSLSAMKRDADAMPGMSADMGRAPPDLEGAPVFDRAFLDAMVPHHRAAIRMARRELAKGRDEQLRQVARSIITVQAREIAEMQRWRQRWYAPR